MELLKNPTFMTWAFAFFSVMAVVVGVYRETLYREKGMEMQKRLLEGQTAIENTVKQLVNQGKITKEAAQEILKTVVSSQVNVEEKVITKTSPEKKGEHN